MDIVMEVCARKITNDCWGCPFKEKATRSKSCMEWIENNKGEAMAMATQFKANGWCLYDRENPPFAGRLADGRIQQVCKNCQKVTVLKNRDVYRDEYIGKYMWTCPHCHREMVLMKQKAPVAKANREVEA